MKKHALLMTIPAIALAAACGENTGKVGGSGGGSSAGGAGGLPYTPEGCGYQVSAPDGTERCDGQRRSSAPTRRRATST